MIQITFSDTVDPSEFNGMHTMHTMHCIDLRYDQYIFRNYHF